MELKLVSLLTKLALLVKFNFDHILQPRNGIHVSLRNVNCGILIFFPLLTYGFPLEKRTCKTWLLPTHRHLLNIVLMFVCLFEEINGNLLCAVSNH